MRAFVGVTDGDWFRFLRARPELDEVNFWQPGGGRGTVQNEGASKGILVTTSGYGKASFEFAQGKPLELLDGANLLYLLAEHAGMEAKIEVPDDWVDPTPEEWGSE